MNAALLLFPGAEELDVFGPYEVFRVADLPISLVTLAAPAPLVLAHGAGVIPHAALDSAATDLLIVPGGGWNSGAPAGARAQAANPALHAALRELHARGAVLAGVCTGGMLLAGAGLLRDRPAVTHHSALDDLRAAGARVMAEARVVDAGDIVTCGGVTAGLDLALHLIERLRGAAAAADAARAIEYPRVGTVWRA